MVMVTAATKMQREEPTYSQKLLLLSNMTNGLLAGNVGLETGNKSVENLKAIAREFVNHARCTLKAVATETLKYLKPYKDDLGSLYDHVKESVKDILKNNA
ncbi:hypothetical protein L5515_002384 [Caenorhabditis briggsae]|uniref:Uncharacterized protein n=1 Tax=Caenorhabditis briggsae TaxID=6238 RepID=A0AAE9E7H0_CAEBR|nr:hypothetical protein L5515_002384 [Caenorhabditis briggsae]